MVSCSPARVVLWASWSAAWKKLVFRNAALESSSLLAQGRWLSCGLLLKTVQYFILNGPRCWCSGTSVERTELRWDSCIKRSAMAFYPDRLNTAFYLKGNSKGNKAHISSKKRSAILDREIYPITEISRKKRCSCQVTHL